MRNENYINELVEFLNDDALTEMEIQTEYGEDERFETFIKLKRTSPRAGKPMLCVYGVPTHRVFGLKIGSGWSFATQTDICSSAFTPLTFEFRFWKIAAGVLHMRMSF